MARPALAFGNASQPLNKPKSTYKKRVPKKKEQPSEDVDKQKKGLG